MAEPPQDMEVEMKEHGKEPTLDAASSESTKLTKPNAGSDLITFKFNVETLRVIAYCNFWFMVIFAIIVTKISVPEEKITNSALVGMFGYNNICVYWDYSPSRELTALVYVFVEIPLLLYVFCNGLRAHHAFLQGRVSSTYHKAAIILLPAMIIILAWFRMIFVVIAFENVVGHTVGFEGLQVSLVFIAILNNEYHHQVGTFQPDHIFRRLKLGLVYAIFVTLVTTVKLTLTISLFVGHPVVNTKDPSGAAFAQFFDILWMILNAVIPLLIALKLRKVAPGTLTFTSDLETLPGPLFN